MKNYDLSQYIIRSGNTMIFPLTQEEISILMQGIETFSSYIRLAYYAKKQHNEELNKIAKKVDMNNDYWFLNTQWVAVDVKAKAIVGTLRLENVNEFNKIVFQVTDEKCQSITREDVLDLFYRFWASNNYVNIVLEDLDKEAMIK